MIVTHTKAVFDGVKPEGSSGTGEKAPGGVEPLEGEPRALKYVSGKPLDADASGRIGESGKSSGSERNAPSNTEMEKPPEGDGKTSSESERSGTSESKPKAPDSEDNLDELHGETGEEQHGTTERNERPIEENVPPEGEGKAPTEGGGEKSPEGKERDSEQERDLDEFPAETSAERHETTVGRGKKKLEERDPSKEKERETENRTALPEPEPPAWPKNIEHPSKRGDLSLEAHEQFIRERWENREFFDTEKIKVVARIEGESGEILFFDCNQDARLWNGKGVAAEGSKATSVEQGATERSSPQMRDYSKIEKPESVHTEIADEILAKAAKCKKPPGDVPNWNLRNLHGEGGLLHFLFELSKQPGAIELLKGKNLRIIVEGKKVCNYCRSDIKIFAEKMGLQSLEIVERFVDSPKTPEILKWTKGDKSWKSFPID
ncbi:MAG: hypothetical protein IPK50_07795 [Fibrobacterota bacterium]|nr:MAG: hypothetical protein IPK50_07795 [Fibrobacterota bacterium]